MDSTRKVYEKLYDLAQSNLNENSLKFEYSKKAFILSTECFPGEADISDMNELDNMSFIQAAYIMFFYRTLDKDALNNWYKRKDLPIEEFRKKVIGSLIKSQEFLDKKCVIKNNIYSVKSEANRNLTAYAAASGGGNNTNAGKAVNKLYRIYKKFPKPIKNLIRKILKVE